MGASLPGTVVVMDLRQGSSASLPSTVVVMDLRQDELPPPSLHPLSPGSLYAPVFCSVRALWLTVVTLGTPETVEGGGCAGRSPATSPTIA